MYVRMYVRMYVCMYVYICHASHLTATLYGPEKCVATGCLNEDEIWTFHVKTECNHLPGESVTSLLSVRLLPGTKLQAARVKVSGYENSDK